MLGGRHDTAGGCQVSVRLHASGHEPIWTSLERLRLPGRHLTVAPASAAGTVVDLAVARRTRPARGPSATGPVARAMPALREGVSGGRAAHPAGRRRATDPAEFPAAPPPPAAGRHRAHSVAGAGRHRAADTGAVPVLS